MSRSWTGVLYNSGTLTASGDSGWLDWTGIMGEGSSDKAIVHAWLRLEPADLATDETLALDLNVAFTSAGAGDVKIHDFTGVTSTNAVENLIIPGGESESLLIVATDLTPAPIPDFFKLTWTIAGTTPSMSFILYATAVVG